MYSLIINLAFSTFIHRNLSLVHFFLSPGFKMFKIVQKAGPSLLWFIWLCCTQSLYTSDRPSGSLFWLVRSIHTTRKIFWILFLVICYQNLRRKAVSHLIKVKWITKPITFIVFMILMIFDITLWKFHFELLFQGPL